MNFDFSEEQKLLQKTARDFLDAEAPLSLNRQIFESAETPYSTALWKAAAENGWLGAAIPEEYGGAGFGRLELAVVAEEVGRAVAPIPFSSSVYLFTEAVLLAASDAQKQTLLPKLAAGELVGTFAHSERAGQSGFDGIETTFSGGTLDGVKLPVADGAAAQSAIVVAKDGGEVRLVLVDLDADGVTRENLESFDPSRSLQQITFSGVQAELLGDGGNADVAQHILDRAAALMSFEQLGGAARAFELTHEFTLGRYAFGRPIASFQAIKHRLADLWCEIELARSNCYYAAWALENDEPELGVAAATARIGATSAFHLATVEQIQLHGGVGYTWEYDDHLFYRRAKWLGAALGSARSWRNALVDRLVA